MTDFGQSTRRAFLKASHRTMTGLVCAELFGQAIQSGEKDIVARPQARVQTAPVPNGGDAADDPALWLHPTHPEQSLLLGTDKQGGLHVYNLDGSHRQIVGNGSRPNNVDVLYGFRLGGHIVDLAVATTRAAKMRGVKIWRIDPRNRHLVDVTHGNVLPVFGGREPYGCCTYRSAGDGGHYFFANEKSGAIEQHRLEEADRGTVRSRRVRTLRVKTQPEGCVADDELGRLYVGEERVGVAQDGSNAGGNQNFKLYAWEDIAGDRLLVDTRWSPRSA